MEVPWWLVCSMAAPIVGMGLLLVSNPWIDWCARRGAPDIVCVAGLFTVAFGLGCAVTYLLLAGAG